MDRKNKYSLVLLAGGKSSRMGQDKAELLYQGKTFLENLLDKAEKLGLNKIYLSGHEQTGESLNVQIVWDEYPGKGPMSGLHACMKKMGTPYCLVIPVDVPQIPVKLLELILKAHSQLIFTDPAYLEQPFVLEHGDRIEPLIGIYPAVTAAKMEELLQDEDGHTGVFRFIQSYGFCVFQGMVPQWQVANINTPDRYEQLLKIPVSG